MQRKMNLQDKRIAKLEQSQIQLLNKLNSVREDMYLKTRIDMLEAICEQQAREITELQGILDRLEILKPLKGKYSHLCMPWNSKQRRLF